jgi:HK97 gp10 family phage protein
MLVEVTITPNLKKLISGLTPENMKSAIRAGLLNLGETVEAKAVPLVPVRTSNLVNSVTGKVEGDGFRYVIRATAKYAKYVHEGTGLYGPHKQTFTILPKTKGALHWQGAKHPVKKVVHKGQKPQPFLRKALAQIKPGEVFEEGVMRFLTRRL